MTAIECLKCDNFNEDKCWCDYYEDSINENYKGYCNCEEYWGNHIDFMSKTELWDIIDELILINNKQNKIIDDLRESVLKSDKSREYWVKKYSDLCDELIKNNINI